MSDRRLWLSVCLGAGLTACEPAPPVATVDGGEPDSAGMVDGRMPDAAPADEGLSADMALDAEPDGAPDAGRDAAADMAPDAVPDAIPDAIPDANADAISDAMLDATPDAFPDAMPDAELDAMPDAIPDSAPDVELDMAIDATADRGIPFWDAALDQAVDAEPDRAIDAAPEPDMMPFDGPARSDDFEVGPLGRAWRLFNPQIFDHEVRDGALWMTPRVFGLWFDRNTGPLIHQPVTGDFRVTARVRARRASAPDMPPEQLVHVGGLMARDPRTPPENYVFIVVGRDVDDLSVETKTTEAGRSVFEGPMWPHGSDAELRICRLGDDFHMYKRPIEGGEWALAETFERADLPETLQVGAIAYTNSRMPDLTVGFEEIVFADVAEPADCVAD